MTILFDYGVRNLWARLRYILPTVAAVAGTAAAVAMLYSLAASTEAVLVRGKSESNMVVVKRRAKSETSSSLKLEVGGEIKAAPGVAQVGGVPQVSLEYVGSIWLDEKKTGAPRLVRIRGVDPIALDVHSGLHLSSGRLPRTGERGVVVGRLLMDRFVDLNEGGAVHLGRIDWPVLGTLESDNAFESEVWCDRTAILDEFHNPDLSVAYVKLEAPGRRAEFAQQIDRIKGIEAISEDELIRRRVALTGMDSHVWILRVLSLLLALAAAFACLNALHSSFQSRLRELATLLAVGYRRSVIVVLALQESCLIALAAAVIGLPIAFLIDGQTFAFGSSLFYVVHVQAQALLIGLATVASVAVLGGLLAVIQVRRMNVLVTLRA